MTTARSKWEKGRHKERQAMLESIGISNRKTLTLRHFVDLPIAIKIDLIYCVQKSIAGAVRPSQDSESTASADAQTEHSSILPSGSLFNAPAFEPVFYSSGVSSRGVRLITQSDNSNPLLTF